jgi:hypothetical protein
LGNERDVQESGTTSRVPLVDVFRDYWKQVLVVAGAYLAQKTPPSTS